MIHEYSFKRFRERSLENKCKARKGIIFRNPATDKKLIIVRYKKKMIFFQFHIGFTGITVLHCT